MDTGRDGAARARSVAGARGRALLSGEELKRAVAARARALGFDLVRVTTPDAIPEAAGRLGGWLAAGHHGSMDWMASERRRSPRALWADVRSVVMLGTSYAPAEDPLPLLRSRGRGVVATYAARRDYHEVMKGRLKDLAGYLTARAGAGRGAKVFVDTAPVMEKPLAAAAGLGWTGKHSVVVSRQHGSWLLLGCIFTGADLPADPPEEDHCGSCRRCLDVCPTQAFPRPYELDARRCISYLTIEHRGPIPREFRAAIGNRVFGCDDCLAVCPWNRFAEATRDARMALRPDLASAPLRDLARLDDAAFRAMFAGTPVKRTGRDRFVRNVAIAIGNSGDAALAPEALRLLDDPASIVRGAATWALARLMPPDAFHALAAERAPREADEEVRAEWRSAVPAVPSPAVQDAA